METILINKSDLKYTNGKFVLKRKYGSNFKREVFKIDINTNEGQEVLQSISE